MDKPTITPKTNGPYIIQGPVRLVDPEGKEFPAKGDVIALCRCGQSSNKPFCDGTHGKVGFQSTCKAP